jgi:hypothetical protein
LGAQVVLKVWGSLFRNSPFSAYYFWVYEEMRNEELRSNNIN